MPANVIAGARIKIQRVGVRVIGRRELQPLAGQIIQPAPERSGAIQFGNVGGLLVDRVPADTAALLVSRQIIAIHGIAESGNAFDQSRRNLGRQEILDVDEGSLPDIFGAQTLQVERTQS